jgi:isoleucyl-tRNA synthetase
MYKPIDLKEKANELEKRVREHWEKNNIFEKSMENRTGAERFIFFEGPPTANGKPGIHHVLSRAIKDTVCRYKTMQGLLVKRKAGWDTHGLPVEIEVEKKLSLSNKNDVERYGIEKFNNECKASVFSYEKEWTEMTKTMGYWVDLDSPYVTLKNPYIETVWWILKQLFDKNLIYKGHKIVPYCPSCGTPLSSHEVAQGYQDVEDPSVFVKFRAIEKENTYFLAWTTTPWTLISNVALVVNPDDVYVEVLHHGETLILAKERLCVLDGEYTIVTEFTGQSLEHLRYEQIFPYKIVETNAVPSHESEKPAFYICCGDYVSMSDGTGIVHTAPAFGQDDYKIGMKYGLPFLQPVDEAGKFTADITDFAGLFVKDADKGIIRNLKDRNLLYKRTQIVHNYPFCWRCHSPLIYFARSSWYIRTSEYKSLMIKNNDQINWYPSFVGEKRFGEWLNNNVDWALSRDRFWGTPLNIWRCDDCQGMLCVGSIADLCELGRLADGSPVPKDIELHRPYVDDIYIPCPKCSKLIKRTPEVIDCWFDSGSMPFAQWHYPFENADIFDTELFPADFICEGIDQTRGWFYTLLAISTMIKGVSPYKNVLVNDLILDKFGQKMSKSKGNVVDPMPVMHEYGADATRWYLLYVSPPWTPTKFDIDGLKETYSKFFGTLKNVFSFYITYASIDGFDPYQYIATHTKSAELDRWIYSRLHSVVESVTENNDNYDFTRSLRMIQKFVVDDVSNWYVRRSRRRYWAMTLTTDKIEAYLTLHEILVELSKLIAPFAPFVAEEIYMALTFRESVHLESYPKADKSQIDSTLEAEMQTIVDLVTLGRAARNQCQIKVRQTLPALYVPEKYADIVGRMKELIKEEINVQEIVALPEKNDIVRWSAKLNLKSAGPKFGKNMKAISTFLDTADINVILQELKQKNAFSLNISDETFDITRDDIFISIAAKDGFAFENDGSDFIALDTKLTPELILEGHAREIVNKIQYTRKENNFHVMDKVCVSYHAGDTIDQVMSQFRDYISAETLSDKFVRVDSPTSDMKMWDINGIDVHLKVTKL